MALKSEVEQLWLDLVQSGKITTLEDENKQLWSDLVQSGKITTLEDENKQLWSALVQSGNIRYNVMPIGAGVAVVSDGAAAAWAYPAANLHITIQDAGLLPADPCWLVGVEILAQTLEAGCYADLAIGFGADAAGIDRAEFSFYNELAAAAGVVRPVSAQILPFPVRITGNPRLAGRIRKSSVASAVGITVKVIVASAIGT